MKPFSWRRKQAGNRTSLYAPALAPKERAMPTHFTATRLTIALVIVVLTGVGFKQASFAQHAGGKNAKLEMSRLCQKSIPEMKIQDLSFVFPNI
jgi:hypothetical protein